jgi:hypothetical protein
MLFSLNTLNQMFKDSPDKSQLLFDGCCQSCGCDFSIEIHHPSPGGYGLLGGLLYENDRWGRRLGFERRRFSYTIYIPERRSGKDRRSGEG